MLQSYEAIIENDQVKWLTDAPKVSKARVIVTILPDTVARDSIGVATRDSTGVATRDSTGVATRDSTGVATRSQNRVPASSIAGKGKTLGDLVSPIVLEQDWECLK
jgi:hypothetical protein